MEDRIGCSSGGLRNVMMGVDFGLEVAVLVELDGSQKPFAFGIVDVQGQFSETFHCDVF